MFLISEFFFLINLNFDSSVMQTDRPQGLMQTINTFVNRRLILWIYFINVQNNPTNTSNYHVNQGYVKFANFRVIFRNALEEKKRIGNL